MSEWIVGCSVFEGTYVLFLLPVLPYLFAMLCPILLFLLFRNIFLLVIPSPFRISMLFCFFVPIAPIQGDTAVYLLFAYARFQSIVRKGAEEFGVDAQSLAAKGKTPLRGAGCGVPMEKEEVKY